MNRIARQHFSKEQYDALLEEMEKEKEAEKTIRNYFQTMFSSRSSESIDNRVSQESTLSSTMQSNEQVVLNESLLNELKDAYLGVDDVRFQLRDKDKAKIDYVHKQYFGAYLKEESFQNVLKNMNPFTQAYEDFYKELLFEPKKKKGLGSIFSKIKGLKMPEKDTVFFDGLNAIRSYIQGDAVQNIGEKVDYVLAHRDDYTKMLSVEERKGESSVDLKKDISTKRYQNVFNTFKEFAQEHSGTTYMCPAIDSFIEEFKDTFMDLGVEIPFIYKRSVSDFLKMELNAIIQNGNIEESERGKIKQNLSNLDIRLYGRDTSTYTNVSVT